MSHTYGCLTKFVGFDVFIKNISRRSFNLFDDQRIPNKIVSKSSFTSLCISKKSYSIVDNIEETEISKLQFGKESVDHCILIRLVLSFWKRIFGNGLSQFEIDLFFANFFSVRKCSFFSG